MQAQGGDKMASSYKVKQGNIFGRVGEGFGRGLAQQLPEEIERGRLAHGLEDLAQNAENLTLPQQLGRLASLPGATPQLIDSYSQLLRHQAQANALASLQNKPPQPFPEIRPKPSASAEIGETPTLTKGSHLEDIQKGYIPPTQEQIYNNAGRMYNSNPALFGNDPQKAIQAAEDEAIREEKRFEAGERQHGRLTSIQDNLVSRLKQHSQDLGAIVPATVYSKIEDKAIQATKPRIDGGRGLTEQQAMKEYGKELDEVSREYQDVKNIGGLGMLTRSAQSTLSSLKTARDAFAKRGELREFADFMVANNNISYPLAYAIAEPVNSNSSLTEELNKIPPISAWSLSHLRNPEEMHIKTKKIAKNLAEKMGNSSPLAISYELNKKGYDPQVFLDYIIDNKFQDMTGRQIEQARKSFPNLGSLSDLWLSSWSGIGE